MARKRNSKLTPKKSNSKKRIIYIVLVIFIIIVLTPVVILTTHSGNLGKVNPVVSLASEINTGPLNITWPASGDAAIGVSNYGLVAKSSNQTTTPTASIAKIVTALCVLKEKPLGVGEQGSELTIGPADVAIYNNYVSEDGSVAKVSVGEQISEYQVLQAMLLPSANNMADTLANWAFGSIASYTSFANSFVQSLGMSSTHIADASGFLPATNSSPTDLLILGQAALNNPVISQIISQKTAVIPIAGQITNVDWLLGQDGVIGIKTGNTDQAGGCYLFAARYGTGNQFITIIGSVMNASTLQVAIDEGANLLTQAESNIKSTFLTAQNSQVASYKTSWGDNSSAINTSPLNLTYLQGMSIKVSVSVKPIRVPSSGGQVVGQVTYSSGSTSSTSEVILGKAINRPSWLWIIEHPSKL